MSKKKSDEQITKSIEDIMKKSSPEIVITPPEPPQKVYAAWGKKPKK